ncbi:MAG: Prolyl-tRNA synthetase, partial [Bacteriovoracaceae bacterium]|nr:Prolyl-tRNA synthetase [Bacteriovoracaceae bacterium]
MRWSRAHIPTLRDVPQDAEIVSHQLMIRAGFIRKLSSGIYSYLPLGWKVIHKIENIIREEMNAAGAQEVLLPFVQPKELWEESGRWQLYGKEMARLKDRHENEYALQPTSEEAVTDLVRKDVKSYRQLPLNLYQIQTKFRDEIRPRFGVMRSREFIMKDAYSFDIDEKSAIKSYEQMRIAYRNIFTRTGLKFKAVDADTGAIGGSKSEEFTVLADSGEDEIVACETCDYGANQEKAVGKVELPKIPASIPKYSLLPTPGLKTIEDLARKLGTTSSHLMKTMIATDGSGKKIIVVLLRGDHELHEVKLAALLSAKMDVKGVRLATDAELEAWKLPKGSLGPVEFPEKAIFVMDDALSADAPYVTGANKNDFHFENIVLSRDAKIHLSGTFRRVNAGEICVKCGSRLKIMRGIEVGHVFYLGQKYSKAMKFEVTNESGKLSTVEMGCYGIGVGRTLAACIEQNNDKDGIVWPLALAPYEVAVISLGEGDAITEAEKIYRALLKENIDV